MTRGTRGPDWHFKNRALAGDFGEKTVKWSMGKRWDRLKESSARNGEEEADGRGADLGYETT